MVSLPYKQLAPGYNQLHQQEQERKLELARSLLDPQSTDTILDVGCGTGLSSKLPGKITGIDPSEEMLDKNPIKNKVLGKAENLPFLDNSFDKLICLSVLQNVDNLEQALKEMARVTKNRAVISVPKRSNVLPTLKSHIPSHFLIEKQIEDSIDWFFVVTSRG